MDNLTCCKKAVIKRAIGICTLLTKGHIIIIYPSPYRIESTEMVRTWE